MPLEEDCKTDNTGFGKRMQALRHGETSEEAPKATGQSYSYIRGHLQ